MLSIEMTSKSHVAVLIDDGIENLGLLCITACIPNTVSVILEAVLAA